MWSELLFAKAVEEDKQQKLAAYAALMLEKKWWAKFDLEQLERTEWSPQFEGMMRRRLLMGALRYGKLAEKRIKGKKWDLLEPIAKKVALYESTGNIEYLVDAANYCLLAFECDDHPLKHFQALDDHHDHCKERTKQRVVLSVPVSRLEPTK